VRAQDLVAPSVLPVPSSAGTCVFQKIDAPVRRFRDGGQHSRSIRQTLPRAGYRRQIRNLLNSARSRRCLLGALERQHLRTGPGGDGPGPQRQRDGWTAVSMTILMFGKTRPSRRVTSTAGKGSRVVHQALPPNNPAERPTRSSNPTMPLFRCGIPALAIARLQRR
jgi:hypothetical protein